MKWISFKRTPPPANVNVMVTDGLGIGFLNTGDIFQAEDRWAQVAFELSTDSIDYEVPGTHLEDWAYISSIDLPYELEMMSLH